MSLILRIESGPHAGTDFPIKPGEAIRVGRTERSDYTIAEDTFLSSVHFELRSDGHSCTLLDLNSSNGTTVRGSRIQEATLSAGDRFTAGQTNFMIVESTNLETIQPAGSPAPLDAIAKERLLKEMRTNLQPLYAVLDAAHDTRILAVLSQYRCEYVSLFHTDKAPEMVRFAPYLVALPPASDALEPLVEFGWGEDWGIYLTSAASGGELIQFLRRLLISALPDGQEVLLRFYDPRVLRTLLSKASPQQWSYFFGPVQSYLMADSKPQVALGFAVVDGVLERHTFPLAGEKPREKTAVVNAAPAASQPAYRFLLSERQVAELAAQESSAD